MDRPTTKVCRSKKMDIQTEARAASGFKDVRNFEILADGIFDPSRGIQFFDYLGINDLGRCPRTYLAIIIRTQPK